VFKEFEPRKAFFLRIQRERGRTHHRSGLAGLLDNWDYFLAFALPAFLALLDRALEPYLDLKHARHRASRLFLKDGARSSVPQYLQTSLPDWPFDGRLAGRAAFRLSRGEALAARVGFFTTVV
jgi:hypothetical protein